MPQLFFAALACALAAVLIATSIRVHSDAVGPRHVHLLSPGNLRDWKVYGGTWEVVDDAFHNGSDERGAKIVSGSAQWTDYTLQADLHLDGYHGDMGVVVRSNAEEEGVDAYRGYYAGLRTMDGTLVIGRADYGWLEARPVPMPGGVNANTWYRIVVTAYQCSIAAQSENLSTHATASVVLEEHPCVRSGRIGLRSLGIGGRWRNISVGPASLADYLRIQRHVESPLEPEFPKREADYNRIFPTPPVESAVPMSAPPRASASSPSSAGTAIHIGDLLELPRNSMQKVILRGVVTLVVPGLYIQDSTGGVLVDRKSMPLLNVGDVVEVRGQARAGLFSAVLQTESIRELWTGTPVPPISITPSQAASGAYDARYIEVEGRLTGDQSSGRGTRILDLTDGVQSFRAFSTVHSDEEQNRIAINSVVRVRGICVVDQHYTEGLTPFAVLLRSGNDVQVIADPPWWTPWHAVLLFAGILGTALLLQVAYFRIQRWKADTITRERERLAHEIHDTMAQGFAGLGYQIQGIRKIVHQNGQPDLNTVSDQLTLAYQLVRRCHEEASRTISMLSATTPRIQENLLGTLEDAARRITGEQIRTTVRVEGTPAPLSLRVANGLMHIGREAIANAAGHAEPNLLELILRFGDGYFELIVRDNGRGFNFTPEKAGFGISGMQKRARDLGSTLEITSSPGNGTEVSVRVALCNESFSRRAVKSLRKRFEPRSTESRSIAK
jgi:hypothetical protein